MAGNALQILQMSCFWVRISSGMGTSEKKKNFRGKTDYLSLRGPCLSSDYGRDNGSGMS